MTDITACDGAGCPLRFDCYRLTMKAYGRRDFFGSAPYNPDKGACEHFISNDEQLKRMAYSIWEERGCPEGEAELHWQMARQQLRNDQD